MPDQISTSSSTNLATGPHILVVRLSALGDVILAQPTVQALQANLPSAKITWLIDQRFRAVADALPGVEVIAIPKPTSLSDYWRTWTKLNHLGFDVVLAMQANFRVNLLYAGLRAKRKIGFDPQRARDLHSWFVNESIEPRDEHLFDGFAQFAKHASGLQFPTPRTWPGIPTDSATGAWWRSRRPAGRYVVVHAGASKAERCWPAIRYGELAKFFSAANLQAVITGGKSAVEQNAAEAFKSEAPASVNLSGATTLAELQEVIAGAAAVVTPDTAAVHLARAKGVPVVGLYAIARSALSGPYRADEYTVDKYDDAVRQFSGRDPKQVGWHFRVHDGRAMNLITASEVWTMLQRALRRSAAS